MLKGHPKGLLVAFFSNMGERFGFYTMMAILVLFLQAKYDLSAESAGSIYSWFYFAIYALALLGGILADWSKRYKTVILFGIIIMFAGYILMAMPGLSQTATISSLFVIAFGNGLFKGNLQAVVGQMYDDEKYSKFRDSAFMIFYMGINVGAFFAPFVATGVRNWMLRTNGFLHDGSLPSLCHQYQNGNMQNLDKLQVLADKVNLSGPVSDLGAFATEYLDLFARGYNYAFGIAAGAMVVSLLVYVIFNRHLPAKHIEAKKKDKEVVKMPWSEEKPRLISLGLVFIVVIFFWMSFHQNGLTLTMFARDYTVKAVGAFTYLFFDLNQILAFVGTIVGIVLLLNKKLKSTWKMVGAAMFVGFGYLTYYFYSHNDPSTNPIEPEIFQSYNPLFIVTLTFVIMGLFAWLNKKGIEPSTPRKIGIGMIIASFGFVIILVGSLGLISPFELGGQPVLDDGRVSPYWLMSSYLILTIAELFLSPMGLSFVSKVSPPRFQGLMQGGWLLATALGNKLLFVGSFMWDRIPLWSLWLIFVICCLASAAFIFSIMKRLEKVTGKA
ncbi:MAG: peptide MFS transporter [Bacteroidales bacterium]|nr:peptide MFS transporter [Bacteroidales bacterium]